MKRRLLKWIVLGLTLAIVLLAILPNLMLSEPVRMWIIDELLRPRGAEARIEKVRLGWFVPTRLEGVELKPVNRPTLLRVDRLHSDRTMVSAMTQGVNVGKLIVDRPEIHIWMDDTGSNLKFKTGEPPKTKGIPTPPAPTTFGTLDLTVRDASLWLKTATMPTETAVFQSVTLRGQLIENVRGRYLDLQPDKLLDHTPVTNELCSGILKYIMPILAEATWTRGEISLDLQSCSIDLNRPEASVISGRLTIHALEAGIKNELIRLAADQLAEKLGREQVETIRLANEAAIAFHIRDGEVWHDGLEFGLPRVSPDLVVRSSGTVSFADQLNLRIDIPIPLHLLSDGPLAQIISGQFLSLRVQGSFDDPQVDLDQDGTLLTGLLSQLSDELSDDDATSPGLLSGLRSILGGQKPDDSQTLAPLGEGDRTDAIDAPTDASDVAPIDGTDTEALIDEVLEVVPGLLERLRERRRTRLDPQNEPADRPLRRLLRGQSQDGQSQNDP